MSIRAHILTRLGSALPLKSLHVPEWDTTVFLKSLTLGERLILKQLAKDERAVICRAIRLGVVDADGVPIFGAEDEAALLSGDGVVLEKLARAVLGHARPKDPEALEKKMRGDPERRIAFRIALALGCTVDELYARMSFAEFQEWLVFLRDDPLPDPWLQTGVICATIANHAMNRSPNATPRQPRDFMPLPSPRPRTLSTAQLHSAFAPYRRDPSQSEPRPS